MKSGLLKSFIILAVLLTACRPATPPPPVAASQDVEFTLAPGQSALLTDADLTIRLIGVGGDARCPSDIECAVSGPVSISLTVQKGDADPAAVDLQTFTDNNGRTPGLQFEGITDRTVQAGYLIRVTGVLPYPAQSAGPIGDLEYRVTLVVTEE
jgi:hypothetical protein